MGFSLFTQEASYRTKGEDLQLCQRRFRLNFRKNCFTEIVIKH